MSNIAKSAWIAVFILVVAYFMATKVSSFFADTMSRASVRITSFR